MISYQEHSYLGQVLARAERTGLVRLPAGRPICETEFSATAKNMVLNWLGMAWLPLSLVKDEIASGQLADLSSLLGQASLAIAFYARPGSTFDAEFVDRAAARLSAS